MILKKFRRLVFSILAPSLLIGSPFLGLLFTIFLIILEYLVVYIL